MNCASDLKVKKRKNLEKEEEEDQCLVCGDQSIGLNFGIQTCAPCKAFFRRNAIKLGV